MDYEHVLNLLKQLQDWQQGTIELRSAIDKAPEQIAELESEIEDQAATVTSVEERLQAEKKRGLQLEADLAAAQNQLAHYNEQIFKVKTNEQLWALQKEINFTKNKISDLETQMIESMEALDQNIQDLEEAKDLLNRLSSDNKRRISELEQQRGKMQEELTRITEGQEELRDRIPLEYLELYDRILESKGDAAIAIARDETCQACYVRIRPQTYLLIRHGKGILQCDNCRRILYYQEEPPLENPAQIS